MSQPTTAIPKHAPFEAGGRVATVLPSIATLMYHEVTDDPTSSGFQRPSALPYKHKQRAFEQHLTEIAAGPCRPELVSDIDFRRPERHLLLTFDDGGTSAAYVSEELCRRGWRGHFFIVTSLIGSRGFLDARTIREISNCGHIVGSHSHTHPTPFRDQSRSQLRDEWRISCDRIGEILGEPCITASVPGGDSSAAVYAAASVAGVRYLFTSEPRLTPELADGCWILGRASVKARTSAPQVHDLVHFRGWTRALLLREMKGLARTLLPVPYRYYVRSRGGESR